MRPVHAHGTDQPTREDLDRLPGAVLLEFGTEWCGYCRAAKRLIDRALVDHPQVHHIKVEDGPGRSLGRSFRVRLWPTLVLLRDGREVDRLVRPTSQRLVTEALARLASPPADAPEAGAHQDEAPLHGPGTGDPVAARGPAERGWSRDG